MYSVASIVDRLCDDDAFGLLSAIARTREREIARCENCYIATDPLITSSNTLLSEIQIDSMIILLLSIAWITEIIGYLLK